MCDRRRHLENRLVEIGRSLRHESRPDECDFDAITVRRPSAVTRVNSATMLRIDQGSGMAFALPIPVEDHHALLVEEQTILKEMDEIDNRHLHDDWWRSDKSYTVNGQPRSLQQQRPFCNRPRLDAERK